MLCLHPFLHIAVASFRRCLLRLCFAVGIEIVSEMLQQSHLFLEFSLGRIIAEPVRSNCVCLISLLLLNVLEILSISVHYYLGGIVEVDSG